MPRSTKSTNDSGKQRERERERERERDAHLFSLFFDFYSLIIFHFIYLGEVEK